MAARGSRQSTPPGQKSQKGQKGFKGLKGPNGYATTPTSKAASEKKGFSLLSIISRLLTWYSIITVLFRCPSTIDLLTDASPGICKPYFHLRSAVAPHLEPYYDVYAAPYVDAARPYYDTLNTRVITPVTVLAKTYGAPRVAQAQAYGQAQWEKNLQPQVLKYQEVAAEQYDQHLAPHIEKVTDAVGPYYDIARVNALQTYYEYLLPTYTTVQPYAVEGYSIASHFTVNTAIPYSQWALATTGTFLDRTVFPKLRILYGENVEPQLVKIGERLGRYRDGKKLKAIVDEIESSSSVSSASSVSAAISSASVETTTSTPAVESTTESTVETATTSSEAVPVATPLTEQEIRAKAEKIVAEDLKKWQEKFLKAADEGSDYLEDHIAEITERLVENQAKKVGTALNIQLEEAVLSSLKDLKSTIISIVKSSKDTEEAEKALTTAVRKAGIGIKEKAQAVRTWRQSYDRETASLISKSAEDTFEILDHIRDLGLQEIGMRWAWTDGITHRDWAKYHKLKSTFDEWRLDVERVVTEHPGVAAARAASEDVENVAMATAEQAAKELARLKQTGKWKISASDTSDDWTTKSAPIAAAAAAVGQKVLEKLSEASEAVVGTSQGTVESVASVASSSAADATSSVSSVASSSAADAASSVSSVAASQVSDESATSDPAESASSVASSISSSVIGTQQGSVESVVSAAQASASDIIDQASSTIIGTSQGSVESVVSSASTEASSLAAEASLSVVGAAEEALSNIKSAATVVLDSTSSVTTDAASSISSASSIASESASDASSSLSSEASEAASTISEKVWGGAVAQSVEAKQVVLDDVVEGHEDNAFSEKIQSIASEAGERLADVTEAVSEVLLKPTSTGGPVEQVTALAAEQYSSAIDAASAAVYGTEQGAGESVASVVTGQYSDAVSAASAVIYGTPTPAHEEMYSSQSVYSRLSSASYTGAGDAGSSASSYPSEVYESATSVVSALFTLPPAIEAIVEAASSRMNDMIETASIQLYGTPKVSYEQVSSSASAANSAVQTTVSDEMYESKSGYALQIAIGNSIWDIVQSAELAIFEAIETIYGASRKAIESERRSVACEAACEACAAAGSYVGDSYAKATKAILSPELVAAESAMKRVIEAMESTGGKLYTYVTVAEKIAWEAATRASENVEHLATSISSAVDSATSKVKDEL